MPKSERMELRVTPEMRTAVDAARGDVPRNVWIERAIEEKLGTPRTPIPEGAEPDVKVVDATVTIPGLRSGLAPSFNRVTSLKR